MSPTSRGEEPAIAVTFATPAAFSMRACTPIGTLRPAAASAPSRRRSTKARSAGLSTFGTTMVSGESGRPASATMSWWHHGVRGALTRTLVRTPRHCGSDRAATTVARASSLTGIATASSRSMTISSAPREAALASIAADEPGTERHERRGAGVGEAEELTAVWRAA